MKKCFVIMPIGSGKEYDIFRNRYEKIIKPAVEELQDDDQQIYECERADLISKSDLITHDILKHLYESDVVIADLSKLNPNVFYELGVRHALRNKTVLIALKGTKLPFDVSNLRIIFYEDRIGGEKEVISQIQDFLKTFVEKEDLVDSPVFLVKGENLRALNDDATTEFWNIFLGKMTPKENVYVVLSAKWGVEWVDGKPIIEPGHTAMVSYNEVAAFFKLQQELRRVRDELRLVLVHGGVEDPKTGQEVRPEYSPAERLIVVGSRHANRICARIMPPESQFFPYRFEMIGKVKCINVYQDEEGKWLEKAISFPSMEKDIKDFTSQKTGNLEKDFGIISRITNPIDASGKSKALILAGNHGFGTESAVNFVANFECLKELHGLVEEYDFEALFEACVDKDKGLTLGVRKIAKLKDGKWQPVSIPRR